LSAPVLEIDVDPLWGQEIDWEALANRAAAAAAGVAPELAHDNLIVSLVLASDREVHDLNRQWRAKDKPTNVLSFPMAESYELQDENVAQRELLLGDIILAHGICEAEAGEKGVPFEEHAAHLLVHGTLHLLGYDHLDDADAAEMEWREVRALARLGIRNPYERT